jgi:hypothetical protein
MAAPTLAHAAGGAITACVNTTNGQVRIVDANTTCRVLETRIQWNSGDGTLGTIVGQVQNQCTPNTDLTHTLVYVEGHAFAAYTGSDGKFQIDSIPGGTYKLIVERNGQKVGEASGVVVNLAVNGGLMTLPPFNLANTQTDPNNCGACGNACQGGQACTAGVCSCGPNQTLCNSACVDTNSDPFNCGSCGQSCAISGPGQSACLNGACTLTCSGSFKNCDNNFANGCETDTSTSTTNCGGCGITCAAGQTCAGGICTGGGGGLLANGAPCGSGSVCQSGFCTDGVCCNQACSGTCQACAAPLTGGVNGVCAAATAGTDPHNTCPDQPASSCGTTGLCNGGGTCAFWPSGTQCAGASCSGGMQFAASMCNGAGTCLPGAGVQCQPYVCGPTQCETTCVSSNDCVPGFTCSVGKCVVGCPGGQVLCGSTCTDTVTDPNNCGGCGKACLGGQSCVAGVCSSVDVSPLPLSNAAR